MYDPTIGRWLQEDPIGFEGEDANMHRFVGNAPSYKADPSGLEVPGYAHFYPLFLGGSPDQRVFELLDKAKHTAAHDVLRAHGVQGKPGNLNSYDQARARWLAMTPEQRTNIVRQSMQAAGIQDIMIERELPGIMKGDTPGVNRTSQRTAPRLSQRVSAVAIQEAGKLAKLATAIGGTLIFASVGVANDQYVSTGEKGGYKMVDSYVLSLELQSARGRNELPTSSNSFIMAWRNITLKLWYEHKDGSWWIVAKRVTLNSDGTIREMEDDFYLAPGKVPLAPFPGCPITTQTPLSSRPPSGGNPPIPTYVARQISR
jgi:hypothetical protein